MGRTPCCEKNNGLKRGPWTPEEDQKLVDYIQKHGYGNWRTLPNNAGLQRCGKSCRLRWTNYLRPDIKRGRFSFEEEEAIIQLHSILGNKWSAIASRLPGRTDNEIKNYWNTHIRKRLLRMGIDPVTHSPRLDLLDLSSHMNTQHLNPELLKLLASSLFSNNPSSSSHNITTTTTHQQDIINCNPQIQNNNNHIPQQHLFVDPNVDPYQSNFHHDDYFGSPSSPQQHNHCYSSSSHQLTHNWHTNNGSIASSSHFDDNAHQLPSSYNNDDYYYDYNNNYNINNNNFVVVDPPLSEIWTTFQCSNNNSNQNLSNLASVLSTPSSSPKPLNSNSTYVNGSSYCSREDERSDSYISQQQQHYVEI